MKKKMKRVTVILISEAKERKNKIIRYNKNKMKKKMQRILSSKIKSMIMNWKVIKEKKKKIS